MSYYQEVAKMLFTQELEADVEATMVVKVS